MHQFMVNLIEKCYKEMINIRKMLVVIYLIIEK